MSWYRSGTVTAAAGQNVITGTGTQWANNVMGVAPGQAFIVQRANGNTLIYEILAVDSNTRIRINGNVVDALSAANYGIQTSVANSYSALARETSAQLALYQQLLQDWQQITTGTGSVSIIAPDGSTVVIPSLAQLSRIGIGLPTQADMANFDWQNFVFTSGANYVTSYNTWVNPPAGITYNAGTRVSIRVIYISTTNGPRMGLELTPDTGSSTNFKVYKLLCVGAAGSRVFTFNQDWNSANPVPITGGGTGATTAAGALVNLGLAEAGNTSGKLALIGNAKTDTNKCAVIVKTGSNANGKYRIWSDGSIDMWGNGIANVNGDALVNYPIALPAAAQNVTTTPLIISTNTNRPTTSVMVVIDLTTATKATFIVKRSDGSTSADGFYWSVNYAAF